MTTLIRAALGLAAALAPVTVGAEPAGGMLEISRGHAEIVRYADAPGAVILGDASIAVANLTNSGVLVLTALSIGVTNVIVLGEDGAEVDRFLVRVPRVGEAVSVRRAMAREKLVCDPACRAVGDIAPPSAAPVAESAPEAESDGVPSEIAAVTD